MALSQQKFREIVLQLLYSQDIAHPDENIMTDLIMNELSISKKNVRLAQEKVQKIVVQLAEIDSKISSVSLSYHFNRIQTVTKNILRLGVFELFFETDIPQKVVIAEAIRLSRKFSTPESASFVNALLDQLYQKSKGEEVNSDLLVESSQILEQSEQVATDFSLESPLSKEKQNEILDSHENT
ncbi:transcription antitermination factor NusB [Candidatus Protochlamydia sp. W-9]|uniref:transcription antitermination factor NusB n=1 Tax=Candidatus Protochlamydia sp. W-9 TaxID=1785087 RepID=UPI00096A3A2E|nr:transcription antitermination factor NusB [Candidatus Protochlamydia sp. W-9]